MSKVIIGPLILTVLMTIGLCLVSVWFPIFQGECLIAFAITMAAYAICCAIDCATDKRP